MSDFEADGCLIGEMQEWSDAQLLRDYAASGREAAFRELVARYTDLVYSAAARQVESPDAAADVAQSVLVDLARKARAVSTRMAPEASLAGWLHRATRYAALNDLRNNRRRLTNERQAMEQILIDSESPADWEHIRPLLDEALDSLEPEDREAVLLRYFKNQDFRAVGRALGVSDDAAQKRVSRAVERLRKFFSKRKITAGAGALAALLIANAVQAAPAGLAAAICTAVLTGTAMTTSTAITAAKTVAMTTLQKALVTVTVTVLAGAGIYEGHRATQLRNQNRAWQQQQASLTGQIRQLQAERDEATNQLAGLRSENARLKYDADQTELLKLRGEVARLRRMANSNRVPDADSTSSSDATNQVPPEDQFILKRVHAVDTMGALLTAMKAYAAENNGQYPESPDQLIASGHFATSNFLGNLGPDDFEIPPAGTTNFQGQTVLLQLRAPIPRPGYPSITIQGDIDDHGAVRTVILNTSE